MQNQNYPNHPIGSAPHAPAGPGSFIQHLHTQGKSGLFLTGIILFSIGTVLSLFVSFSFLSVLPLLLAALPITGLWLIYAASKKPILPEKTLTSLTLFKIDTIFTLVVISLAFAVVIISLIVSLIFSAAYFDVALGAIWFALVVVLIALVIIIPFYFVAILRIIASIRANIVGNTTNPLRGVLPFSILAITSSILGILGSLVGLAFISVMGNAIEMWFDGLISTLVMMVPWLANFGFDNIHLMPFTSAGLLLGILTQVGTILMVVSLNRLAGAVKR